MVQRDTNRHNIPSVFCDIAQGFLRTYGCIYLGFPLITQQDLFRTFGIYTLMNYLPELCPYHGIIDEIIAKPMNSSNLDHIFSEQGPLAETIPGYRIRRQQLEMAQAIETAIKGNQQLVAEAGTGTGKTFAYLIPALLSGGKVIIFYRH